MTSYPDSDRLKASQATPTHSQRARDGREPAYANSHIPEARGAWGHHRSRPTNSQNTKAPSIQVVSWVKMGLGHSHDDLRAPNAAPQPLRGGAYDRPAGVPWSQRGARRGGWGRDCTHAWVDIDDLHRQHAHPSSENHLPQGHGRLLRARGSPICARQTAQGRGERGRGLMGGAKAGSA